MSYQDFCRSYKQSLDENNDEIKFSLHRRTVSTYHPEPSRELFELDDGDLQYLYNKYVVKAKEDMTKKIETIEKERDKL